MTEFEELGEEIVQILFDNGMIKVFPKDNKNGWTLHNGMWSPFYIQLRPIFSARNSKGMMDKIGDALATLIKANLTDISKIVGVASAGVPISVIVSYKLEIPLCYTRRVCNVKTVEELESHYSTMKPNSHDTFSYGEHSLLEGQLEEGDNLLLIDDLITNGVSKLIARKQVEYQAKWQKLTVSCDNVSVVLDREQGGKQELKSKGIDLYSLIPFKTKGIFWLQDKLDPHEFDLISDYLKSPDKYQDIKFRQKIFNEFK